jgi:hypothetical protein
LFNLKNKKMRSSKGLFKILLAVFLMNVFVVKVNGQIITSAGGSSSNDSSKEPISQDDLQAVIQALDIEIYKFNLNIEKDQKCKIILYKQEYEKRNVIKNENIWGTTSPFRSMVDGKLVETLLKDIRIITKKNDREFALSIKMGDFKINKYSIKIDSIYANPHACKPFKLPNECKIGSNVPLLLIGSFWDSTSIDGKMKVQRFCMEKELNNDFSSKSFDEMPHYFVIGIKIEEI